MNEKSLVAVMRLLDGSAGGYQLFAVDADGNARAVENGQLPAPAKMKSLTRGEQAVRDWLATDGNGVVYLGSTSLAYAIEGNFVKVAASHLGRNDQFSRPMGRKLAIDRLQSGGMLLRMPSTVCDKTYSIHLWLRDVFGSQFAPT